MRSVIILPIMGEKLMLTLRWPDIYKYTGTYACIDGVHLNFDCTRRSSSVAISNLWYQKYIRTTLSTRLKQKSNFSAVFSF